MTDSHVLVIGAASIDTKGRAGQPIQGGTSTPGAIRVSVGGVGRNIAENLARLGESVMLLSAVGDDDSGYRLLHQAGECGIEIGHMVVTPSHRTAAYLAVLDQEGNMVMSVDDMAINRDLITPDFVYRRRALFRDASMVVLDANLSSATLRTIFGLAERYALPVCADPTTASLAPRLLPHLDGLTLIAPDAAEAQVLCGQRVSDRESALIAVQKLQALGIETAVVTLGATGLVYATSHETGHVPAIKCEVVDLIGAGDALTAALVFGLLNGFEVDESARLGVSAAALTLQCRETVCPALSLERLYDQMVL